MTDKSKFKNNAPFGFRAERMTGCGLHPALFTTGDRGKHISQLGPATYSPKKQDCKHKNGIDWNIKLKAELYSIWLGWKNMTVLEQRRFMNSLVGPGTHEINPALFKQQLDSIFENTSFTSGKRYSYIVDHGTPSPNAYFYDLSKRCTLKKGLSNVPTMEWDGFIDRFLPGVTARHSLSPTLYKFQEHDKKNTADITKKLVSVRGPYDLFTGKRDETTMKGFYHPKIFKMPDTLFSAVSKIDMLLYSKNYANTGKFLKEERFPKKPTVRHMLERWRDPALPGPAHYDLKDYKRIVSEPPDRYPFLSCKITVRPSPIAKPTPGPGRYNIKIARYMKQKRNTYVFVTKYPRVYYRDFNYRSF
ncbi:unnamed protein product [Phyllotreta striolata]|uniref:Uncharacterized protein n=1 Tax=Phyllotreta striolata TaxID=444603 RepID=A0A9N9XM79_PHYSR|nr:unnamed protein product [Phyllotreta striolata]